MLEADEAAHLVAGLVEQQQRQEPGGAAIAIEEGVDAEEIEDVGRDEEQGLDGAARAGIEEAGVQFLHRLRGLAGREGLEAEALRAVGEGLGDFVVGMFPLAAAACREAVEVLVHLEDERGGEGDS